MKDIKNMPVLFTRVGTKEKQGEDTREEIETGLTLFKAKHGLRENKQRKHN